MIPGRRTSEGQLVITAGPPLSTDPRMAGFALKPTGEIYASGGQSAFTPADLFLNGEQGAWYDPSDLTTMFQDRAGTTQVTADGQTVGLILDKSKGLVLGSELVTNGDFSNGTTGWTAEDATLSDDAGRLKIVSTFSNQGASQVVTTVSGKRYQVTVTVVSASGSYNIGYGNLFAQGQIYDIGALTGARTFNFSFIGNGVGQTFWFYCAGAGTYIVDNISVKELQGNHAVAPSDAARPLYKTDGTYHWLQFDGVDDSLSTAEINFTGTDKMSVFSGVKKNNDTASIVVELSSSIINNGSFYIVTGTDAGGTGYTSMSKGTAAANTTLAATAFTFNAPDTAVLTATHDIAGDLSTIRRNGTSGTDATADKGTGNFGNYPLYIGSRATTSLFLNGNIHSLIVRGALSTTQEITDTEAWVNGKTGAY